MDEEHILVTDEQVQAFEELENDGISLNLINNWNNSLDKTQESVPRIFIRASNRFSDLTEGDKFTTDKLYELTKLTIMTIIAYNQTFRNYLDKLDESIVILTGNIHKNRFYEMCKSFSVADGTCDCCGGKVILSNDTVCHRCRNRLGEDFYIRSEIVSDMDDVVMNYLDRSQRVNLNAFY